jgi:hypothetical protein
MHSRYADTLLVKRIHEHPANPMLRRSQMTAEELQRALPRQFRRLWFVIFALIAIESVARVIQE